tara:strand:- start:492 stop:722 length:231 start_codon:yes stop_codon:yes gene_type:complete
MTIFLTWNSLVIMIRNLIPAAQSCRFINERIIMEQILLDKVLILEDQLERTQDAWLKRIWEDHINDLMRKVARLEK